MDRQYEAAGSLDIRDFWTMKQADTVPIETESALAARLYAKLHGMGGRVSMKEALHVSERYRVVCSCNMADGEFT